MAETALQLGTAMAADVFGRRGKLTTLYSFCTQSPAAARMATQPFAALTFGSHGWQLYGSQHSRRAIRLLLYIRRLSCGTVSMITPRGTLTTLHAFTIRRGRQP